MGSTFEDLDATSTPVKSDSYLSTWIVRYFNFRIQLYKKKREKSCNQRLRAVYSRQLATFGKENSAL